MRPTIGYAEMLHDIDNGKPFDVEFATCDRRRGTGGELRAYSMVVKASTVHNGPTKTRQPHLAEQAAKPKPKSNTIRVYIPQNRAETRLIDIHPRLITRFNGKEVL